MKKYIKQISLLVLFVVFASCTNDTGDHNTMPEASGRPVLGASSNPTRTSTDSKFKRTNIGQPIYIYTFLKKGVTLKSLVVHYDKNPANNPEDGISLPTTSGKQVIVGDKITDTTINDATASFNSSTLITNPAFDPAKTKNSKIFLAFIATFSDGSILTNGGVLTVTP